LYILARYPYVLDSVSISVRIEVGGPRSGETSLGGRCCGYHWTVAFGAGKVVLFLVVKDVLEWLVVRVFDSAGEGWVDVERALCCC
jgi:hypothetical protein